MLCSPLPRSLRGWMLFVLLWVFAQEGPDVGHLIVGLDVTFENGGGEVGSGIVFAQRDDALYVATAAHVIARGRHQAQTIDVSGPLFPGRSLEGELGAHLDEQLDLAVVRVPFEPGTELPRPPFARVVVPAVLRRHHELFLLGYGPGLLPRVDEARTGKLRSNLAEKIRFLMQGAEGGDSGGGLFTAEGNLIGMVTEASDEGGLALSLERILLQLNDWGYPVDVAAADNQDREPNDDRTRAGSLGIGASAAGEVGGDDAQDWFQVLAPDDGYLTIELHHTGEGRGTLLGPPTVVGEDGAERTSIPWTAVAPGKSRTSWPFPVSGSAFYYVGLRVASKDGASVPYRVVTAFEPLNHRDGDEPNDGPEQACSIESGADMTASVGFGTDAEDWCVFTAPEDGFVTFSVRNLRPETSDRSALKPAAFQGEGGRGRVITTTNSIRPGREASCKPVPVTKGERYHVVVVPSAAHHATLYRTSLTFAPLSSEVDREPNDSAAQALELGVGEQALGAVGFGHDASDWFELVPPGNGLVTWTIRNEGPAGAQNAVLAPVTLWSNGARLGNMRVNSVQPGDGPRSDPWVVHGGKPYQLLVRPPREGNSTSYRLSWEFRPNPPIREEGAHDSPADARTLASLEDWTDEVGYAGDRIDWFRFEAPAAGRVRVDLQNLHAERTVQKGGLAPPAIFDEAVEVVARTRRNSLGVTERVSTSEAEVAAGDVLFSRVEPNSPEAGAPYLFRFVFQAAE